MREIPRVAYRQQVEFQRTRKNCCGQSRQGRAKPVTKNAEHQRRATNKKKTPEQRRPLHPPLRLTSLGRGHECRRMEGAVQSAKAHMLKGCLSILHHSYDAIGVITGINPWTFWPKIGKSYTTQKAKLAAS